MSSPQMFESKLEIQPNTKATATSIKWKGHGDLMLCGERWGYANAIPVIFLHGGGQTRHTWNATAARVARRGYDAFTVDCRGHGESDWAIDGDYGIEALIVDLVALIETHELKTPVLVGASMGGLTSLVAAGEKHLECSGLVLVDIAPRVETRGVEKIISFMRGHPDGFETIEQARAAVVAYNPNRKQASDGSGLQRNLRLCHDGRYRWHWDPRLLDHPERSNLEIAVLQQARRIEAARNISAPSMLVRGTKSDIVSDDCVDELRDLIPHVDVVEIADAGHMVAGDRNDLFADAVISFLDKYTPCRFPY